MKKAIWIARQLLPLTYWSKYRANGKRYFTIWRMWFGQSFDVSTVEVS